MKWLVHVAEAAAVRYGVWHLLRSMGMGPALVAVVVVGGSWLLARRVRRGVWRRVKRL